MSHTETLDKLRSAGFRLTKARQALVKIFSSGHRPYSAKQLETSLKESGLSVSVTTIYRELEFLEEQELIAPVMISSKEQFFESTSLEHHHHAVCIQCGSILELEVAAIEDKIDSLATKLASKKEFQVIDHSLEFFGTCSNC